jgi:HD-GYP domain-containing protein (c-di-GMP phosphodiesterase class II)
VHVCDVFDALHTDRPYRDAWPSAKALHYIERRAGREFDPIITAAFITMMRKNERVVGLIDENMPVSAGQSVNTDTNTASDQLEAVIDDQPELIGDAETNPPGDGKVQAA